MRWYAMTPANGVRFSRRHLVFPRILDPGCVIMRLQWPIDSAYQSRTEAAVSAIDSKLPLLLFPRIICLSLLPEIFIGMPLAYYVMDSPWSLFGLIVLIYTQVLALVIWLFASRRKLELTWQRCIVLAFESLVCIPYAINFHRKTAESVTSIANTDLFDIGERVLGVKELGALRNYVQDSIEDRMTKDVGNEAYLKALAALRSRLGKD